jgi:hypothetical protein
MKKNSYNVLSSYGTGDFALANHILTITGAPAMDFRKVLTCSGVVVPVAETAGVITLTPTNVASTQYAFELRQYFPDTKTWVKEYFTHTTAASGSSATTISTALKAAINAADASGRIRAVATGTTTVVITADAGSPLIFATSFQSNLAVAATTPGVLAVGTYNALLYAGVAAADIASGHTYASINFVFEEQNLSGSNAAPNVVSHTVYYDAADSDYATVNTAVKKILAGVTSGTTSNAEAVALANT